MELHPARHHGLATRLLWADGRLEFPGCHLSHLYYKRAATDAALLGSAEQHRSRVADLVLDTATTTAPPRVADGTG